MGTKISNTWKVLAIILLVLIIGLLIYYEVAIIKIFV